MKRQKVLLSAYACRPGTGSEPGTGWNVASRMAEVYEVWVLTREDNRPFIEGRVDLDLSSDIQFFFHDIPRWLDLFFRHKLMVHIRYYIWQISAIPKVRKLQKNQCFDSMQHVTYGRYAAPSALSYVKDVPFIWGTVGGGESAPLQFWPGLGFRGVVFELLRNLSRAISAYDPLVRRTARRSAIAFGTTQETLIRLKHLGAADVRELSNCALGQLEIAELAKIELRASPPVCFLSLGRLLAWKGYHLGLAAFARADLPTAEYCIIGDGPERQSLERLAKRLGVGDRVRFFGQLPRTEVLTRLAGADVLVHPSLHDASGWVCLEAMAAGRPVICLDLGGPALQVTEHTGIKVAADNPTNAISSMAEAMRQLAEDLTLRHRMARDCRKRVANYFTWDQVAINLRAAHRDIGRLDKISEQAITEP